MLELNREERKGERERKKKIERSVTETFVSVLKLISFLCVFYFLPFLHFFFLFFYLSFVWIE